MSEDTHTSRQQQSMLMLDSSDGAEDASGQQRRRQLFALLRGRWHWALLLGVLLGGALGAAGYYAVTPEYASRGAIEIPPVDQPGHANLRRIHDYAGFMQGQVNTITSPSFIRTALNQEPWQAIGRGKSEQQVRRFNSSLNARRDGDSHRLIVSFTDPDPESAVAAVQSVQAAYTIHYRGLVSNEQGQQLNTLRQRERRIKSDIRDLEAEYQRKLPQGIGNLATLEQKLSLHLDQQQQLQASIDQTRQQIDMLKATEEEGSNPGPITEQRIQQMAQQNEHMRSLLNRRNNIESRIQQLSDMGIGPEHRQIRRERASLNQLERQIEEYARNYEMAGSGGIPAIDGAGLGGARVLGSLEYMENNIKDRQEQLAELSSQITTLGQAQEELRQIRGLLQEKRDYLVDVQDEIDAMGEGPSDAERISMEPPSQASVINDSKRKQLAFLGGAGGFGFGVGLIMLIGLLDRRFRRVDDAELTFPSTRMLGILPTLPANMKDPEQAAIAAHCVHHIRTMLQLGGGQRGNVFTVTSPAAGSGKTSLTTALGVSFAASGSKTLLIDCDVIGGGLSRRLGTAAHRSLEDVIRREGLCTEQGIAEARRAADASRKSIGETLVEMGYIEQADLERATEAQRESAVGLFEACDGEPFDACVTDSGVDNLYLLPIGMAVPEQAGSLSPSAMQRLLSKARGRFDTVLIDTGPILGSIEASMSSAESDGVILVVSRGDQKAMVIKSLSSLNAMDAPVSGIVFNHATEHDVARSSYASVASTAPPGSERRSRPRRIDSHTSDRFGPVGSAVAAYSRSHQHALPNGENGESTSQTQEEESAGNGVGGSGRS